MSQPCPTQGTHTGPGLVPYSSSAASIPHASQNPTATAQAVEAVFASLYSADKEPSLGLSVPLSVSTLPQPQLLFFQTGIRQVHRGATWSRQPKLVPNLETINLCQAPIDEGHGREVTC